MNSFKLHAGAGSNAALVSGAGSRARLSPALSATMALLLGMFLIAGAGFAPSSVLHDAAHDTRHAFGLPCH